MYFDALDDLRRRIGSEPSRFVADITFTMFQQRGAAKPGAANGNHHSAVAELKSMFATIDESCAFFRLHQDFFEGPKYLKGFETLRTDLLNGVRAVVTQTLERCEVQVERRKTQAVAEGTQQQRANHAGGGFQFTYHYALFRAGGQSVRPLIEVLCERSRVENVTTVYADCLDFLEGYYVSMRLRLVADTIKSQLHVRFRLQLAQTFGQDILAAHPAEKSVALAVRQAVTFVLSAAQLEFKTFYSIFVQRGANEALDTLLNALGNVLAEAVRPVVLGSGSLHDLRDMTEALSMDVLDFGPSTGGSMTSAQTAAQRLVEDLSGVYSSVYKLHKVGSTHTKASHRRGAGCSRAAHF